MVQGHAALGSVVLAGRERCSTSSRYSDERFSVVHWPDCATKWAGLKDLKASWQSDDDSLPHLRGCEVER